jgi:hypothetical protein
MSDSRENKHQNGDCIRNLDDLFEILSKCPLHDQDIELEEKSHGKQLLIYLRPASRFPWVKAGMRIKGAFRERKGRTINKDR